MLFLNTVRLTLPLAYNQACTGRGIQGGRGRPQAARPAGGPPPQMAVIGVLVTIN
jgi:hypothetical protein